MGESSLTGDLARQNLSRGEGKMMTFDPEAKLKRLVDLNVPPEFMVMEFVLPRIFCAEDLRKYPQVIFGVWEYLNSEEARQNPLIPPANLRQMQADFRLPGMIGEAEFRFDEVRECLAVSIEHPDDFNGAVRSLWQALFRLDQEFDPELTQANFYLKMGEGFNLDRWGQLFKNIRTKLGEREAQEAREPVRGRIARILSLVGRLLSGAKRQD
jgi:hypothetical protein